MKYDPTLDTDEVVLPLQAQRGLPAQRQRSIRSVDGDHGPDVALGVMAHQNKVAAVAQMLMIISNPPTQAEVQTIEAKVDEIIAALKAAGHMSP